MHAYRADHWPSTPASNSFDSARGSNRKERLGRSTTLETPLRDVIGYGMHACTCGPVARRKYILEDENTGEGMRHQICVWFNRFIPLCSDGVLLAFGSTTLTHKYACEVSSKGSMQSLELSRASLACDLRYIGSLDNEHVDMSTSLRKFTRFSCDIGNCTAWKFALVWGDCGIWFLGSVIRSVRDVWKYKYVYIERNIII